MSIQLFQRRFVWLSAVVLVVLMAGFGSSAGRGLARRFLTSLREQKVQTVSANLSAFVGPNANSTLQQMVGQMVSDKVTTTVSEPDQPASDAAAASQRAGFPVLLPSERKDAPHLVVVGEHAFTLTVDRSRLQSILNEAGRPDLVVPQSIDGASLSVKVPRTARAQYGTCPGPPSATANVATPTPSSMQYADCLVLTESRSPVVNVPAGLDVEQLAQIGLELASMTPTQAHDFLQTVNWKNMFSLSLPRSMRSYEVVDVNGGQGTLLDTAGRRGATYSLIWAKNDIVYSLTGFGSSSGAVSLADSLK
jgi:hypothetical protein